MKARRFVLTALLWTAAHFLASVLIVPATLKIGATGSGFAGLLTEATRVLYFPILGLALYPRHWFPGRWIYIPIAGNSLVWGLGLAAVTVALLALYRRSRPQGP